VSNVFITAIHIVIDCSELRLTILRALVDGNAPDVNDLMLLLWRHTILPNAHVTNAPGVTAMIAYAVRWVLVNNSALEVFALEVSMCVCVFVCMFVCDVLVSYALH
jgi:hypothetical protein